MKPKFTLLFLALPLLLSTAATGQVVDDTVRSVIISEARSDNPMINYIELCNVGDTAVNLKNFEIGGFNKWTDLYEAAPGNFTRLPDRMLLPEETFVIASATDWSNKNMYPEYWGRQYPDITEQADLEVHQSESYIDVYDGTYDSVSVYDGVTGWWNGKNCYYLEYHIGGDSAIVDAVRNDLNEAGDRITKNGGWDVAGIPRAWVDYILIRKSSVTRGNTNWDDSRGTNMENSEWTPIPELPQQATHMQRYWTTVGHHGDATLNDASVSSEVVDIDWENQRITVPWGIYPDSLMDKFILEGGIAWNYHLSPEPEDSVHSIVVTGDSLTMYAVGDELEQIDFHLEQGPPADDVALVFPLNRKWYTETGAFGGWETPFYVTMDQPVIDSIGNIRFAARVDTLFKYLEKAPGASWEIDWVDDTERVDLKRGDILIVTAADGTTQKSYFLSVDSIPEPSHNSSLAAITWPDIPAYLKGSPDWRQDSIADFNYTKHDYQIYVPYGTETVPALVAHPEDLNARIAVERAISVKGTAEERTTTFIVTAEDDTTVTVYTVLFKQDMPPEFVQPFSPGPIISEIAYRVCYRSNFLEVSNPGNQTIDLSNYMLAYGEPGYTPAQVIQDRTSVDDYNNRYQKYVPGYMYQSKLEWESAPGFIEKDLLVNPILRPGESFVLGSIEQEREDRQKHADRCNAIINYPERFLPEDLDVRIYVLEEAGTRIGRGWRGRDISFMLFEILNDSIKEGTKPIGDPDDFRLVDLWGTFTGEIWNLGGVEIENTYQHLMRKPEYWEGDTLPGNQGSWGTIPEESEWIHRTRDYYIANDFDNTVCQPGRNLALHTFDPVFIYRSTITSGKYKVSDGYTTPQTIEGVLTNTRTSDFLSNINKEHEDQTLEVIGMDGTIKTGDDLLTDQDTLKVVSADGVNITKYVLSVSVEGLDSDAVLTAKEGSGYTITQEGLTGMITGIPVGSTVREVRNNVLKPATATLNIVDSENNLVPLKQMNFDTVYVETKASGHIYFEVIAEDRETVITYQLQLDIADNEAYAFSDVYEVDQELNLVSAVPHGTSVQTLFKFLKPNLGASIKLVDKMGFERTQGEVSFDDEVIVTSADESVQRVYYLKFLEERSGTEAYVVSDVLSVDQLDKDIWGFETGTRLNIIMGLITPAPEATVVVLDADGNVVESGNIGDGFTLRVTSGDGLKVVVYHLFGTDEEPGTMAYVTSETLVVDGSEMIISQIEPEISVGDFLALLTPAPRAAMTVLDADGNPVETGVLGEGFTLWVTSGDGTKEVEYSLSFLTSVEDAAHLTALKVYPNPATTHVWIEGVEAQSMVEFKNILGVTVKMVDTKNIQNGSISVSELPAGIYFLHVKTTNDQYQVIRFMKQ